MSKVNCRNFRLFFSALAHHNKSPIDLWTKLRNDENLKKSTVRISFAPSKKNRWSNVYEHLMEISSVSIRAHKGHSSKTLALKICLNLCLRVTGTKSDPFLPLISPYPYFFTRSPFYLIQKCSLHWVEEGASKRIFSIPKF